MPKQASVLLAHERIRRILEHWFLSEPLLFILWQDHQLRSASVQTIQTGSGIISYNPVFIDSLTNTELEAVMRCEAVRILLKHPYSRRQSPPQIAWQASNITLREHLGVLPLPLPSAAEVFGHHEYDRQFLEFYHQHLLEQQITMTQPGRDAATTKTQRTEQQKKAKALPNAGATAPNDENAHQEVNHAPSDELAEFATDNTKNEDIPAAPSLHAYLFSSRVGAENTQLWAEDDFIQERIDERIENAELHKRWGSLPGHLRERILANRKPRLDYRSILRLFHQSVLAQKRSLTRMKCNRRYGFLYMGSRYDFTTRLLVAMDVSGSMSRTEISLGFSLINRFFKYGINQIDVITFDVQIQGEMTSFKRAQREVTITGLGGTNFDAVMDYIDQHPHYDGVIIITDGYAPAPKMRRQRRIPLLWIFIDESSYLNNIKALRTHGYAAFIRPAAI